MYKLKQTASDFIVNEISSVKIKKQGKYSYFLLKKTNYTTLRALEHIARILKISLKKIGFAGNKDKNAITSQVCSVLGFDRTALERIALKDIEIEYLGKGDAPICLGELDGNEFKIIARNISKKPLLKKEFINYFGEQRFSKNNAEVGKAIVKKNFKKAVSSILKNKGDVEKKVKRYLEINETDFVGALRKIPLRLLKIYIHSYQSWLWNKAVSMHKEKTVEVPIIGFGSVNMDKCTDKLMQKEKLNPRDFIIKEIPGISSEGNERKSIVIAENVKIGKIENDELNKGKKKVLIKFKLPKGSYATEYVKQLFS